jgi:hypothetical protein
MAQFNELKGKILTKIDHDEYEVIFRCLDGTVFKMFHSQECCESVYLEDVCGDWEDLIGSEILQADEVENETFEKGWEDGFEGEGRNRKNVDGDYYPESHTWTFFKIATIKGYVTLRWFGESNGYYSESVDFVRKRDDGTFPNW